MRFGGRPCTNSAPTSTGAGQPGSRRVVDAAADARARFEHDHAQPRPHEPASRFQA